MDSLLTSHETPGLTNTAPSRGTVTGRVGSWFRTASRHHGRVFLPEGSCANGAENRILFFRFQLPELYSVPSGMHPLTVSLQRSATDVPVETVRTLISPLQSLGLPALHPVPVRGPAAPRGTLGPTPRGQGAGPGVGELPWWRHLTPGTACFGSPLFDTTQVFASAKLKIKSEHPPNQSYC